MFLSNDIIPLNEIEEHLKKYYTMCAKEPLKNPYSGDTQTDTQVLSELFHDLLPLNSLFEVNYIPDDLDCTFVRHLRYLPAHYHEHEFFELLFVRHGSCMNIFKDYNIRMQAGDICICAPGSSHAIGAFSDDDILINILIRKSTFDRAFMGFLQDSDILSIIIALI